LDLTKVTVKVSSIAKSEKPFEADFLVDTGAIDCMVPAKMLKETGIEIEGKKIYELANGTSVEYKYGFAIIELMGERTVTQMIFGPDEVNPS
jgi:predicted aspartyl protease